MKVAIVGYGAMGRCLLERISRQDQLQCVGVIGSSFYRQIDQLPQPPEVIIDVSHPDALPVLARVMESHPVPLVIATTGYSEAQKRQIQRWSHQVPVVLSGNFSIGMTLVNRMLRCCAEQIADFFDCDLVEMHHDHKQDSPSGSALMLRQTLRQGEEEHADRQIPIVSLRRRDNPGEHTVILHGDQEQIVITHRAFSRELFARGILEAARIIAQSGPGMMTMEDLLLHRRQTL